MATQIKIDFVKIAQAMFEEPQFRQPLVTPPPMPPRRVDVDGCRFLVTGDNVRPLAVRPGMTDASIALAAQRARRAA